MKILTGHALTRFTHLSLTAVFLLGLSHSAFAKDEIGEVVSVKHSGWATRSNESVKQTLKVGDKLYNGDMLDIKHGNYVEVALDENRENLLHIVGDSFVQLNDEGAINIELNKGQVFALLDNLGPAEKFQVSTPTAISTVRGTHFKVLTNGILSETFVYDGTVKITGRFPNGQPTQGYAIVESGHKVLVNDFGTRPEAPVQMTESEFGVVNEVLAGLDTPKPAFDYEDALAIGRAAMKESSESAFGSSKSTGANGGKEDFKGGKVVF